MKRFHVHLHVDDLTKSIGFNAKLFAAEPARREDDCTKWMLDDPPVNFAISTRGAQAGIDRLGMQTDEAAELAALKARALAADMALLDEGETTCCYARSKKHWVTDPQASPGSISTRWARFRCSTKPPALQPPCARASRPRPRLTPQCRRVGGLLCTRCPGQAGGRCNRVVGYLLLRGPCAPRY